VTSDAAHLFIYYRVRAADATAAIAAARAMQAELQTVFAGLLCALSRRAEDRGDLLTLMETYAHVDGVPADWQHAIERRAQEQLGAWIVGARQVEVFVPCA
jgi:hypothetical protein